MSITKPSVNSVEDIIDTDLAETQIQAFIDAANLTLDEVFDSELSAGLLTELNKWLAAHLLSTRYQRVELEAVSDVSVTSQGETGLGLDATSYGQQCTILDPTGKLSNLNTQEAQFDISSW